jgi:hypothetical protein
MNRSVLLALLSLPLVSAPASGAGLGLRWDSCLGSGAGADIRTFACDSNAGSEQLVGSFVPRDDMHAVAGLEVALTFERACMLPLTADVGVCPPAPVPEWWLLSDSGGCRRSALQVNFETDPANGSCRPWTTHGLAGAIQGYRMDFFGPGTASLYMVVGALGGGTGAIARDVEHFAFTLTISHENTVGPGACSGCAESMAVEFSALKVVAPQVPGQPDRSIVITGGQAPFANVALWQNSPAPVPVRVTTWGAIKSLYR